MSSNDRLPGRRHLYPNLIVVVGVFIAIIFYLRLSLADFTTALVIEGLMMDVISAGMLATVETNRLYGILSNQDIHSEIGTRDRGIDNLETNLMLEDGDPGFEAVKRAYEYQYKQENGENVDINRFRIDFPDSYRNALEKRHGGSIDDKELIEAHREHNILSKNMPRIEAITQDSKTLSEGRPFIFKRFIRPSGYDFGHQREMSYLSSAMIILASGFIFQIVAYVIKFTFL